MSHYFYDMIPAEELAQLHYLPTVPEYLSWIVSKWADRPALSDTVNTYTYAQMGAATAAVASWISGNGYQIAGPMFNIYHVSPHETQNPDEYVTELCFPIE